MEDKMMIPEHCSKESEISEGFGMKELLRSGVFVLIGLVIGIGIYIVNGAIVSLVFSTVCGGACGYVFCKKDRYSRVSVIDSLIDFRNFLKSQKIYEYRRK